MAKLKMKIPKERPYRSYIPEELINEGFYGEVEILADAFTATIFKPGVDDAKAIESLSVVLQDLGLRVGKKIRVVIEEKSNELEPTSSKCA